MPYLPSLALVLLGLVILVVAVLKVTRSLRRARAASTLMSDRVGDRVGFLRARLAALGVAFQQRRPDKARQGEPRLRSRNRGRQEEDHAQSRST
ncbi:bacteriophage holin [Actinosynnema pretiosum subsp. pretiosum]|uniref:Bacteriophage holin n=1 Tax=Actinosynnema pretiosum subsp. pretiosum TaxID=103721 RepID=A0AA45LAG8_9PSEU|nr:bacteriophage holin [Actinosynnema mirum]QUF06125.1 bacteriophage holin [Actinosynnema pretiosum subsp. pretiosum]